MSENSSFYGNNPSIVTASGIALIQANNLSDVASAPTSRTNLGLGTAATHAATDFPLVANNLSDVANATTARGNLTAAKSGANSDITSLTGLTTPLSVAQGGVGQATLAAHGVVVGAGTAGVNVTGAGTLGNVLTSNGPSADPTFQPIPSSVTPPGLSSGRPTLTSGVPVMTSGVTAATTVYFTPYKGNTIPVWNGSVFVPTTFTELSNVLANSSVGNAGPAAAAASQVYDLYVWNNAGTLTLTRSPAWSAGTGGSNTVRGTGVGGSAQSLVQGYYTNTVAITNGPAAGFGTYVGTIATDSGGGTVSYTFGGVALTGTAANLNVWSQFNRVNAGALVGDSTSSWTYSVIAFRAANNSIGNRVNFVIGLVEDAIESSYFCPITANASGAAEIGIGLNSTTAYVGSPGRNANSSNAVQCAAAYKGLPALGANFISAIETADASFSMTFSGVLASHQQMNLQVNLRM